MMLCRINEIYGYKIIALDGEVGSVQEFYFDDRTADIRYLIVNTGNWLFGKKVLISPVAIKKADWDTQTLIVDITREQVKNSPHIDISKPVSRCLQNQIHAYYGWPNYWSYSPKQIDDPHLRSTKEVKGYHIQANDGEVGHIEDFIVDEESWIIRYIVVNMKYWIPGKKVIVSPAWVEGVDWFNRKVYLDLSREEIKDAPEFDHSAPVN